jgi:hypothetical protein
MVGIEGHVGVIWVLLRHGADVNAQSDEKVTSLHFASVKTQLAVVRVLLEHGMGVGTQDKDTLDAKGRGFSSSTRGWRKGACSWHQRDSEITDISLYLRVIGCLLIIITTLAIFTFRHVMD